MIMREVFFEVLYASAAVIIASIAAAMLSDVAIEIAGKWRTRRFPPCGVHDFNDRPCMMPDGHPEREHGTAWVPCDHDGMTEHRHRFDDVAAEGREERRTARGILLPVTRSGDTVPVPATK